MQKNVKDYPHHATFFSCWITGKLKAGTLHETIPTEASVLYWQAQKCDCTCIRRNIKICTRGPTCRPFLAVIQTPEMREYLVKRKPECFFMDATGSTNMYRWLTYAIIANDEQGMGIPITFMITSWETWVPIAMFLQVLLSSNEVGLSKLKQFMIDKSDAEIKAIKGTVGD